MKYEKLNGLLSGFFYQCWNEFDDRTADSIVDEAIEGTTSEDIKEAIKELDDIFVFIKEKADLDELIGYKLGCNYVSENDGISSVEWLVYLKNKLFQHSKQSAR